MITYHRTTVPVLCRTPLEGCAELRVEKLASRARLLGGPDLQACVPTPPGSYRAFLSGPPLPAHPFSL